MLRLHLEDKNLASICRQRLASAGSCRRSFDLSVLLWLHVDRKVTLDQRQPMSWTSGISPDEAFSLRRGARLSDTTASGSNWKPSWSSGTVFSAVLQWMLNRLDAAEKQQLNRIRSSEGCGSIPVMKPRAGHLSGRTLRADPGSRSAALCIESRNIFCKHPKNPTFAFPGTFHKSLRCV